MLTRITLICELCIQVLNNITNIINTFNDHKIYSAPNFNTNKDILNVSVNHINFITTYLITEFIRLEP